MTAYMNTRYPLHRQDLECYIALKLLVTLSNLPNKRIVEISHRDCDFLVSLLDTVILTQKSSINQILPTNNIRLFVDIPGKETEISNTALLAHDSVFNLVESIAKQINLPNKSLIIDRLSLLFSIDSQFTEKLQLNLYKYLRKVVDNQLHAQNSCLFEKQVDRIKGLISTQSKIINPNHLQISSDSLSSAECNFNFIETMAAIFLSGAISIWSLTTKKGIYHCTIGVKTPNNIDVNEIRKYYGFDPLTYFRPDFHGDQTHDFHNGVLYLKLTNNDFDSIEFGKSISARYLFETMYELKKTAPLSKQIFTKQEVVKKYKDMHRETPSFLYKTIEPGYISKVVGNCISIMFKGKNAVYRERLKWEYNRSKDGYIFELE